MILLHQTPPGWGLPNISPFCVKLETYLRMTKIDYKSAKADIMKAPNGRIPYITIDGKLIGDSTLIIQTLKERFGDPLDKNLSPEQKAQALLFQRLVENHFYYAMAWLRWSQEHSWKYVQAYFTPLMPPVIGRFIPKFIRKGMLKDMRTHGMGEHSREEIIKFANADLTALSISLGDKPFFLGDQPSSIDATLYGFLIQQLWIPWDCPVKQHGLSLKNLVSYCERMKQKFWN
jgi:glutathione S-transferase